MIHRFGGDDLVSILQKQGHASNKFDSVHVFFFPLLVLLCCCCPYLFFLLVYLSFWSSSSSPSKMKGIWIVVLANTLLTARSACFLLQEHSLKTACEGLLPSCLSSWLS